MANEDINDRDGHGDGGRAFASGSTLEEALLDFELQQDFTPPPLPSPLPVHRSMFWHPPSNEERASLPVADDRAVFGSDDSSHHHMSREIDNQPSSICEGVLHCRVDAGESQYIGYEQGRLQDGGRHGGVNIGNDGLFPEATHNEKLVGTLPTRRDLPGYREIEPPRHDNTFDFAADFGGRTDMPVGHGGRIDRQGHRDSNVAIVPVGWHPYDDSTYHKGSLYLGEAATSAARRKSLEENPMPTARLDDDALEPIALHQLDDTPIPFDSPLELNASDHPSLKRPRQSAEEQQPPKKRKLSQIEEDDIEDIDVLFGRGGRTNHHPGNAAYLQLIQEREVEYMLLGSRNEKTVYAMGLVQQLREQGIRFLKKDPNNKKLWNDVGDDKMREKVSQNLRERQPQLRKKMELGTDKPQKESSSAAASTQQKQATCRNPTPPKSSGSPTQDQKDGSTSEQVPTMPSLDHLQGHVAPDSEQSLSEAKREDTTGTADGINQWESV